MEETQSADQPDQFIPDPEVWREFGITPMTGWRWSRDPRLGFPPVIKIGRRNFRSRKQLEAFKSRLLRKAITEREAKA
jgi:predicted DNA-binding transcriptional regulator AlpA